MTKSTRHKLDDRRGRLQELRSTGRRIVHGNSLVFELLMLFKKVGDTCLNGGLLAGSDISIFLNVLENGVVAVRKMTKPNAPTLLSNK